MVDPKHASRLSDDDEAEIMRRAINDPDNPPATDRQLAGGKSFADALPELAASIRRGRGRPPADMPKQHVSLRLSRAVLDHYKATGPGWQGRIEADLRKAAGLD